MTTAISVEKLSKEYRGKRRQKVEALKNLSLAVAPGEVYGFLGPNGAGKSTTIKIIVGQIRPTKGQAAIFGEPAGSCQSRHKIGYLPENPALYDFLTAREYLAMVGRCFQMSPKSLKTESERALDLLDLQSAANRPIRGYSKGMVQRLALAQALLHDPELYILDEPMSGLDPVGRVLVKEIMQDLKRRGKTVFFSTHVIADVEAVCDRVAIVANGELRAESAVNEIIAAGIDGYMVRLVDAPLAGLDNYRVESTSGSTTLLVPCQDFTVVMRHLEQAGCQIQMIEPHRKSLEDFFLKMIDQE